MRSAVWSVLFVCSLLSLSSCTGGPADRSEQIARLHSDAIVWDGHNDLAYRVLYEGLDIGNRLPAGHVDIPRMKEGEINVQTVALFLYGMPGECSRQTRELIAGVDHVGLGADMYPRTPSPTGIRGVQDYPNITRGLKERGYSDADVRGIMGGNLLRVWKEVTDESE